MGQAAAQVVRQLGQRVQIVPIELDRELRGQASHYEIDSMGQRLADIDRPRQGAQVIADILQDHRKRPLRRSQIDVDLGLVDAVRVQIQFRPPGAPADRLDLGNIEEEFLGG